MNCRFDDFRFQIEPAPIILLLPAICNSEMTLPVLSRCHPERGRAPESKDPAALSSAVTAAGILPVHLTGKFALSNLQSKISNSLAHRRMVVDNLPPFGELAEDERKYAVRRLSICQG